MKKTYLFLLITIFSVHAQQQITTLVDSHLKNFIQNDFDYIEHPNELTALKRREIVADLFFNNQFSALNNQESSPVVNDNLFSDLNLFTTAADNAANLFSKINHTASIFGELHLIKDLATPIHKTKNLYKKQLVIKKLVENKEAFEKIARELNNIQQNQDAFLRLWLQDSQSVENLFYKKSFLKKINNSEAIFATANTLESIIQWSFAHMLELPAIAAQNNYTMQHFSAMQVCKKIGSIAKDFVAYNVNPKNMFWTPLVSLKEGYDSIETNIAIAKELSGQQGEILPAQAEKIIRVSSFIGLGASVIITACSAYRKVNFYKKYIQRKFVVDALQEQLAKISSMLRSFDIIKDIYENELNISLSTVQLTKNAQDLVSALHSLTFAHKSSLYFEGRVLYCYHKIKNIKDELANLFIQIGNIDAQMAIATLYKSAPDGTPSFCFAEFIDAQKPMIISNDHWNIFIDKNNVVTNSLQLDRNIVLTGVNAGGKSTTIKAFLQNLLLAQTFGIAAASRFACTPFAKISSYLNITDDLANGKSLFKAEVERAKVLVNMVTNLHANEFAFCAIDELFTGTAAEAGQECAYQLVTKLGNIANSVFIFATHYQKLTELENESENFANYRVGAPTKINGKLIYPFTLEKGINTTNVAKEILQEEQLI